jgi:TolB protein
MTVMQSPNHIDLQRHDLMIALARRIGAVWRGLSAALVLLLGSHAAHAQLRVVISGVGSQQFPIAVLTFAGDALPQDVAGIIRANLTRSGMFRVVDTGSTALPDSANLGFADWRSRGADAVVIGQVQKLATGAYDIRFRLFDAVKQQQLDAGAYTAQLNMLRFTSHQIADRIYERITGEKGVFATRIAYVVKLSKESYELQVSDADGQNAQTALRSREPIISPTWSPDGLRLAYVSFEDKKPVVFVHEVETGRRSRVAAFRGSNSAPAFSPDGRTLAVVLTRDGFSQIFTMPVNGGEPVRMTRSNAIDTEPTYSADGQIYFTSDRAGGPQIYRMPATGGEASRVTFRGDYNISPTLSPDGKTLAYVSRRAGRFQVFALDLSSGTELQLTETVRDESPSFAPNGKVLIYATESRGRGALATVSSDGRVRQILTTQAGDIREPAWSPWPRGVQP